MKLKYLFGAWVLSALLFSCDIIEITEDTFNDTNDAAKAVEAIEEYGIANREFSSANTASDYETLNSKVDLESGAFQLKTTGHVHFDVEDLTTFPKVITVDYGEGTICHLDGRERKGKIIITLINRWIGEEGSKHTVTYENYYQDDHKIEGTHEVINTGTVNGQPVYSVRIADGKVTTPKGKVITYQQKNTRTHVAGYETPLNISDDAYEFVGEQYGTTSNGYKYTFTAKNDNPLYYELSCRYIRCGELLIKVENSDMSLDFGDKSLECVDDATATLYFAGMEKEIAF